MKKQVKTRKAGNKKGLAVFCRKSLIINGTGGGSRTHTPLRTPDFESKPLYLVFDFWFPFGSLMIKFFIFFNDNTIYI
jgi:hypothetical protein